MSREQGSALHTMDTLVKYTMSEEAAKKVYERFVEMARDGESASYLDCVVFDAALDALGTEQEYYGYSDEEWAEIRNERDRVEKTFGKVRVIDITDTWKEVLS